MFLPLFIAILLGLVSPSQSTNTNCHDTTVSTADASNSGDPGDGGDTGDDGIDHGGDTGQNPPPKID
ncbi:hypothetical protein DHW03_01575 [Pedobacter yonginense]|uniref:Uncharacterized protein n=1 Tax=Pedobacter yonginense TaxID=651869 RepID=A0A317ENY0_9SPHI|nr:hypothetical protein DHW03_01575 [Pedobacter yonginense]